jgi:hypothetical protein
MHKFFVGSIILVLCTLGWIASSFGQEVPAPRGELRIVDKNPANWSSVVFNVFDHLMELNTDGTLVHVWRPAGSGLMTAPWRSRCARA